MKRILLVLVGTLLLVLGAFGLASAHAKLDHCTPAVGSTVASAPSQVVCVYSEEIDTKLSAMSVWDANGKQVDKQDAHVDLNDPDHKTLIVSLDPALAIKGLMTVKWHAVTPDDGGISDGAWQFVAGSASATPFPPTEIAQRETPAAGTAAVGTNTPSAPTPAGATNTPQINPSATPQSGTPTATPAPAAGGQDTGIWILAAAILVVIAVIGLILYARS